MKTVKTRELTGAALDWAVAKCEGIEPYLVRGLKFVKTNLWKTVGYDPTPWNPSTDWSQGGPIIEREKLCIEGRPGMDKGWAAHYSKRSESHYFYSLGQTPLIAAMRCYVSSKLGDTVKIPDELV